MAYYYVYSPFAGTMKGQDCYCKNLCSGGASCTNSNGGCNCGVSGCLHPAAINGTCCPVDIAGPASTAVRLRVSSNVLSIVATRTGPNDDGDGLCASSPPSGFEWVNEGVKIRMYTGSSGGGTLIGTVFYGHLKTRMANGTYNSPNLKVVGYLGNTDCACSCYSGIHTHMTRSSGNSGYTYHHACNYSLTTSSTLYRWTL